MNALTKKDLDLILEAVKVMNAHEGTTSTNPLHELAAFVGPSEQLEERRKAIKLAQGKAVDRQNELILLMAKLIGLREEVEKDELYTAVAPGGMGPQS